MNVGIYIYDEAEVMDFSGPFEVFSVASRFLPAAERFRVLLIGEAPVVSARGGFRVETHCRIDDHPPLDILVVVGGVHGAELKKPRVLDWIRTIASGARQVASVCTGAFILAEAGVLTTQRVTTHWEDIAELRGAYPLLEVVEGRRWVDDAIVTSAGISAGIDMSLYLVAKLGSPELAARTARQMEFDWTLPG
ncbi:MAG: DJ-1/PfpI family protein [Alphaproteobacteria bacterium]|nr:DJ-1/PfpI family protein [Alphaproteobacteria bacterium]